VIYRQLGKLNHFQLLIALLGGAIILQNIPTNCKKKMNQKFIRLPWKLTLPDT